MAEMKGCAKCGAKNQASNSFCEQCGSKLQISSQIDKSSSKPSTSPAVKTGKLDSERREKTFSFAYGGGIAIPWLEIAYALLLLITVFTRFDHLGAKPHHHDESMHAFYSYQLFHDGDYKYDPMMHGPFQFHGNALMYYLFGVSDATSRYLAAFFGLLTVISAMFLSPFWGRTGAFLATAMIVCSPSFMYFDRFTREDAYIAGATFFMVVFLIRFFRSRAPQDIWLASLGFIVAFCTKESIFLTVAVIGTYLFIRLLPFLDVLIAGSLTAFALVTQLIIPKSESFRTPVFFFLIGLAFIYTAYQIFNRWTSNQKLGKYESELWEILCNLGFEKIKLELIGFVAWWACAILYLRILPHNGISAPYSLSIFLLVPYFGLLLRFCWLWLKNIAPSLSGSISIIGIVFTLLFTTFFTVGAKEAEFGTRLHSLLASLYDGVFAGLEYWWGQHDVHRGDQPIYYYLVQLPANELVSFFFSTIAVLYYSLFKRKTIPLFLAYWYVGSFALFSWAGERMPWLILHSLLPSLLLAAYFMGEILDSQPTKEFKKFARWAAIGIFGVLISYSLHSAILLSFYHESNPVEPLVYVQSGPDTKDVEKIVRDISYGETGGPDLAITIEDKCSWPFAWSMKDFPKRNHPATITTADNAIIMTGTESDAQAYPILSKAGYLNRKYKLRIWWVPSWFKKGFPGSPMDARLFFDWFFSNLIPITDSKPEMVDWSDLRKWVLYREVWSDLGSYNMRLWIRPDLAQKYGFTGTERSDIYTPGWPPEPAAAQDAEKDKKQSRKD